MCHEWWLRRRTEEREASRQMWDEFERTTPLSDSEATAQETEQETDVTLEKEEARSLTGKP